MTTSQRKRSRPHTIGTAIACAAAMLLFGLSLPAAMAQDEPPSVQGSALLPRDLSPWGMFMNADVVVKVVMVGLVIASVVTWTVWLAKTIELLKARRKLRSAVDALSAVKTLANVRQSNIEEPVASFYAAAVDELRLSDGSMDKDGLKERIASRLERIEAAFSRRISRGTGVLATIGATAPFVGLFGTVWGIMNSFIGISKSHTTNLAVVAPGNRGSAACDRARARSRDPGCRHLQFVFAPNYELPRGPCRCFGDGAPACQSRPRSWPCAAQERRRVAPQE